MQSLTRACAFCEGLWTTSEVPPCARRSWQRQRRRRGATAMAARPAGGPTQWFTVSARPHSPPKYVCYARHSGDPVSNPALIGRRYLEGRRSGSSNREHFEPKRLWNYCSSQPVESLAGGRALWVQGRVRGHAGSRDTKGSQESSPNICLLPLTTMCSPGFANTWGRCYDIS